MRLQSYANKKLVYAAFFLMPLLLVLLQVITFRQDPRSKAAGSVKLYTAPTSSATNPIQKNINETVEVKLMVDPAQAHVSVIKTEVLYDATKLQLNEANGFVINEAAFPVTVEGPVLSTGKIAFTVSISSDATKAIRTPSEIGTLTFKTLAINPTPVEVKYGDNSVVLSVGPSEEADQNVLGTKESAYIQIGTGTGNPPTTTGNPPTISGIPPPIGGCPYEILDASVPIGLTNTGSEVWITNYENNSVSRLKHDGSSAGEPLTDNGLNGPTGITLIGNEVWVANYDNNTISHFNVDGTPASVPLTTLPTASGSAQRGILGIVQVENQVWVSDQINNAIYRYGTNKEQLGAPIKITGLQGMRFLTVVGQEVWLISNPTQNPTNADGKIYRLKFNGTIVGTPISNSKLINPTHILAVGNEVWVTDELEVTIARFRTNGDFIGVHDLYELSYINTGMAIINGNVWIIEAFANTINVLNTSGQNLCANITPGPSVRPTQNPDRTTLELKLLLHGLGNAGDSVNPTAHSLSNKNPQTQERTLSIQLVNEDNEIIATKIAPAFYNAEQGMFFSNVVINDTIPKGEYVVKVKTDGYLRKLMPGFFPLEPGKRFTMPQAQLVAGDVNGDNTLNVLDYNVLYDCGYGKLNPLPMIDGRSAFKEKQCQSHAQKELTDLTDNGTVDNKDYNLFIRELSG